MEKCLGVGKRKKKSKVFFLPKFSEAYSVFMLPTLVIWQNQTDVGSILNIP